MRQLMRQWSAVLALFGLGLLGCAPRPHLPPVPVVTVEPVRGEAPLFVRASAAESFDPDGTILVVRWDLGDGTRKEGP
ncbi:MAG: hypothetical protein ABDI20_04425, partial [Candidatus Bipolaricaulaceae bacterium]